VIIISEFKIHTFIFMRIVQFVVVIFLLFAFQDVDAQISSSEDTTALIEHMSIEDLLKTQIVSSKKKTESIEEIPASVAILTAKEVKSYGYTSLEDIMSHITGFYMIDDYNWMGNMNFGVRGFYRVGTANNIAIVVNGVSQYSDEYGDYPDTKITVPVEAIKRIEIVKGPMSTIHGVGGFFGAINIITHDEFLEEGATSVDVSTSAGNNYFRKCNVGASGKSNDIRYSVNASLTSKGGIDVAYEELTSDVDLLETSNVLPASRTKNQLSARKKYFGSVLTIKDFTFDLSYNETIKGGMNGMPSFGDGSEITHTAMNFAVKYNAAISKSLSMHIQTGYYQHSHSVDFEEYYQYFNNHDFKQTRAYDFEGDVYFSFDSLLEFDAGIYYRNLFDFYQSTNAYINSSANGSNEIGMPRGDDLQTLSLYSQAKFKFSKYLSVVGGIKLEHLSDYNMYLAKRVISADTTFNENNPEDSRIVTERTYYAPKNGMSLIPQFALISHPYNKLTVKAMYSKSVKQPSFMDNVQYSLINGREDNLSPQVIQTFEADILMKPAQNILMQVNGFYNKLDDLVISSNLYNRETDSWELQTSNSGEMKTIGFEAIVNVNSIKKTKVELSGLYQNTTVQTEGYTSAEPGYSPHFLGYLKASYFISNNVSFGAKIRYISAMESAWDFVTNPSNGRRIGAASESNMIIDANCRYQNILSTKIYSKLNIENLTNASIRYPTTESNMWIDKGTLGHGFRVNLTLGLKL